MKNKIHECEVCGHKGIDVEYFKTNKPGYYCTDQEACFSRYLEIRNQKIKRGVKDATE